jgi:hypothetical protein
MPPGMVFADLFSKKPGGVYENDKEQRIKEGKVKIR